MTETERDYDGSTEPVGSFGPTDVSELAGWQPDFPPGPPRAVSDGPTVWMTQDEILAHYREKTKNPYLTRSGALALRAWDLKTLYLRRDRRTASESGSRLK